MDDNFYASMNYLIENRMDYYYMRVEDTTERSCYIKDLKKMYTNKSGYRVDISCFIFEGKDRYRKIPITYFENIIYDMYNKREQDGDFTIISQTGNNFNCHKCIMNMNEVFKEIIFNNENKECSNNIWKTDLTSKEVNILIMLMYGEIKLCDDEELGIMYKIEFKTINEDVLINFLIYYILEKNKNNCNYYNFNLHKYNLLSKIIPKFIINKYIMNDIICNKITNPEDVCKIFN